MPPFTRCVLCWAMLGAAYADEEEHSQWQDWRLTFQSWLVYAQEDFEKDLNEAETATSPMDFVEMTTAQHGRSEKLHSILVGLLRNRPLKILRSVEGRNGLEVWRQLSQQMQPRTRARSIALLPGPSWPTPRSRRTASWSRSWAWSAWPRSMPRCRRRS